MCATHLFRYPTPPPSSKWACTALWRRGQWQSGAGSGLAVTRERSISAGRLKTDGRPIRAGRLRHQFFEDRLIPVRLVLSARDRDVPRSVGHHDRSVRQYVQADRHVLLHVRLIGRFRLLASRPDPTTRVNATYRPGNVPRRTALSTV